MPQSDSGSDAEFASFIPDTYSPAISTYAGGDASQAPATSSSTNDPLNRKNSWGLLGLYGDNGNLSQYNPLAPAGGLMSQFAQDIPQGWRPLNDDTASNTDSGTPQYHGVNFGDLGFTPDVNNYNQSNGLNDNFLKNLGYTGGDPYSDPYTGQQSEGGPQGAGPGYTQDFQNFLGDKGLNLQVGSDQNSNHLLQAYDKNNNPVGTQFKQLFDPDSQFNYAVMAATAAAGGAAGGNLASGAGYSSGPINAAAQGAGAGFASGLANSSGELGAGLKGAAVGGATGGLVGYVNPASQLGIDNPDLLRGVNNAAGSAVRAGLQGQNIGQAVLGSGLKSGLGYGMQTGANAIMGDDDNQGTGNYSSVQQPSFMSQYTNGGQSGPSGPFSTNASTDSIGSDPYGLAASQPQPNQPQGQRQGNPVMDFSKKLLSGFGGANATGGNFDNMAGNLMQLWQSHQNAKQYGGLASGLQSLYSPNSPYAQQLNQALTRSDAAAGRRSQVGPRNVELQARLADLNSRNAPELARLYGSQQNNQAQMLQSLMRLGMNPMVSSGVGSMFNNYFGTPQQPSFNATANQQPDWAPGD